MVSILTTGKGHKNAMDLFNELFYEDVPQVSPKIVKKLGYIYEPEKITLSYSRRQTLFSCPRKFLLKELNQQGTFSPTIDTSYGHAFAAGVQELFRSGDLARAYLAALSEWDFDDFEVPFANKKQKSFWACLASLQMFECSEFQMLSSEYKLATVEGKEGIELFVYMSVGPSFSYQIHIDLVLQRHDNGALVVAEIKTGGSPHLEASWSNSDQTLGYYTFLEFLSKKYDLPFEQRILYITQQTGKFTDSEDNYGFATLIFMKDETAATEFAHNLLLDVELIKLYIDHNFFPKRGNACVNFNTTCQFFGECDSVELQQQEGKETVYESLTLDDADFIFDITDLIDSFD